MVFASSISNDELAALPQRGFGGRVVVVDSAGGVEAAVAALRGESLLGFDTETRPSFKRGVVHRVCLLQLSTADTCYLFRLHLCGLPASLRALLADSSVVKVGAAIRDDLRALRVLGDFVPGGFVDLQDEVGRFGIEELSVRKFSAIVLGIRISKAQRLSNWEAPALTPAQCDYAAMDAWVCFEVYRILFSL